VQPLAESGGNLVYALIRNQYNDIARGVNGRRADGTMIQMPVDLVAQRRLYLAVNII
jgi:hypothetical protein